MLFVVNAQDNTTTASSTSTKFKLYLYITAVILFKYGNMETINMSGENYEVR